MKIHRKVTKKRVIAACERHMTSLENPGFCVSCGEEAECVEPDARRSRCDHCGERAVFGAEELAIMLM